MENKKYDFVGGWLLLFCFSLLVGTPLKTVYNIGNSYNVSNSLFNDFPGLKNIFFIDSILSVIIIIYSIRAGLALWFIKRNAIIKAKNYLLINLSYCFISSFLPFLAGLPSEANDAMGKEVLKNLFWGLFYIVIWNWYLNVSKRVKGTYYSENNIQNELDFLSKIPKVNINNTMHDINEENPIAYESDIIPEGFGKFGLEKTNPIPICGIENISNYMSQLRYETISKDGSSIILPIQYQRTIENDNSEIGSEMLKVVGLVGSAFANNIGNNIDVYNIYTFDGSEKLAKFYIHCYNQKTSKKAPIGFVIKN